MESTNKHKPVDPDIPQGLEYRDEYWQDALAKIERHERYERRAAFMKWGAIGLSGAVLALLLWWGICSTASEPVTIEENIPSSTAPISNAQNKAENALDNPLDSAMIGAISASTNAMTNQKTNSTATKAETKTNLRAMDHDETERSIQSQQRANRISRNTAFIGQTRSKTEEQNDAQAIDQNSRVASIDDSGTTGDGLFADSSMSNATDSDRGRVPFNVEQSNPVEPAAAYVPTDFIAPIVRWMSQAEPNLIAAAALNYKPIWKEPKWRVGGYAGLSLVTHYASPLNDVKTDPMFGLRIERNLKTRWALRAGLEYYSIGNVRRPYSVTSVAYDINYIRTITTVQTHQLLYLSAPLTAGYRLSRKHQVWFGGGLSYMITGRNEISMHRVTPSQDELIMRYDDSGFVSGFVDFPWFAHLGYEYRISKSAYINLGYQFGLTDITRNAYFDNPGVDRNTRFMVTLGFDAIHR